MSVVKKFGTFAGVYTPSVLTILGVIMYLRLGWVVGEAGLIGAIIIILVAHIISISTGLSISSIATDKKIKTGGIYYILSRSLGLPMGGSIGITLFVGTALSIALYIVGFTENFLGIEAISSFLGMADTINSVRIIGTIVLVLLALIAFISTSLAIKSQFFVLGAIALSLISIFLGFIFIEPSAMPDPSIVSAPHHVPIITIFAIFFPAVTGFTAGVAMSGDLKDPKKSIPKGTMLSIATGLVVYILLAIGIAYFVDRSMLINDPNFLMKIALYSPLVVAGIWGATLSSALGGILGAPRIIQAIANDKIVPRFLGKGYGDSNEPRNALVFTFFIAEMGILIGKLDAIAEVVSMFYIAAYGFINLAFALEKWASTDFRPSFSISKWIGIIGFIASFGVMLELNPGAMVAAFIIMWLIYFLLKRKELKSDFGDVWGSVWSSMVRTSITKLSEKSLEKRNWKPNILLFSGATNDRSHLIDFSKILVGKYGFLSYFDLQVDSDRNKFYTKREQIIDSEEQSKGIFSRRQIVGDLYEGIEQISATYGFAGVEPNMVLLGWGRNSKEPKRFAQMIRKLYQLDLNVVMMDYDHSVGFGDKSLIDVWWRGKGQNGDLSLQLVKFLRESDDWTKAKLRLLIVNPIDNEYENLYRQATNILENLRIDGEVRIINNEIENRSFYEIVQVESVKSSLIFIGLPDIKEGKEEQFVDNINELCKKIGTTVLLRASSTFIDLKIKYRAKKQLHSKKLNWQEIESKQNTDIELSYPSYKALKTVNISFYNQLAAYQQANNEHHLHQIAENEHELVQSFNKFIASSIKSTKLVFEASKQEHLPAKISSIHTKMLKEVRSRLELLKENYIDDQKVILDNFIKQENEKTIKLYASLPQYIKVYYTLDDIRADKTDTLDVKWFKFRSRLLAKFGKSKFAYKIQYKHLLIEKVLVRQLDMFKSFLVEYGVYSTKNIAAIERFVNTIDAEMRKLFLLAEEAGGKNEFQTALHQIEIEMSSLIEEVENHTHQIIISRQQASISLVDFLNKQTSKIAVNSYLDEDFNPNKALKKHTDFAVDIPEKRYRNQQMTINHLLLSVDLLLYSTQLRQFTRVVIKRLHSYLQSDIIENKHRYINYLRSFVEKLKQDKDSTFSFDIESLSISFDKMRADNVENMIRRTEKTLLQTLPKEISIFTDEASNYLGSEKQFQELETVKLSVIRLIDYLIQDEYTSKLQLILANLPDEILDRNLKLQDHVRLRRFSIDNKKEDNQSLINSIEEDIINLQKEEEEERHFIENIILQIEANQRSLDEKLSIYPFVQAAMNLKQYIRKRESVKRYYQWTKIKEKVNALFHQLAAELWYRQSKSLIATQNFMESDEDILDRRKKQRLAILSLSAKADIINKLPFYYKQLFIERQNFMPEFWVERKEAELELNRYISDTQTGNAKALVIRGAAGSGKTYLSYKLASLMNDKSKVYTIIPPERGSASLAIFKRSISEALEIEAQNCDEVLHKLEKGSVLIFEDMELWWRKSDDGFAVIDKIHDFIRNYSNRLHFVLIINKYTFDFIAHLRPVLDIYTHEVLLGPIDALSLEKMIWPRHLSGGLKINLKSKNQDNFHSWDFARLFSKYFRFSKGYPVAAMQAWINNIISVKDKSMEIKTPHAFNINLFDNLSNEDLWILQLFVLHNTMTFNKLYKISKLNKEKAIAKLFELSSIEIITEHKQVYKLNSLLSPYIEQLLKSKKYL